MNPAELTQSLKQEAVRVGFQLTGACAAVTPVGYANFLKWLEAGYAGEMHYLEERQFAYQNPDGVMPGVKSLLMLGMSYRTADHANSKPGFGRVARYAWGEVDYHDLIHKRLKQLKRFAIELLPDVKVRGVVDTAPLLEREFAQLAGLGWRAKNTLLINKPEGSFYLLAALLLDVELEYDQPFEANHCGTCTACLDACPTDAFVGPGVLDGSKCISYLTIEHRSPIPVELRAQMQDWILGCDVCQDVCPWNQRTEQSPHVEFVPHEANHPLELRSLFELDDEQFRQRFRKTPLWRPKRRGILRNAAIALGNQPCEQNIAALLLATKDVEPLVRGAAIWALLQHLEALEGIAPANQQAIVLCLRQLEQTETDMQVRAEFDADLRLAGPDSA